MRFSYAQLLGAVCDLTVSQFGFAVRRALFLIVYILFISVAFTSSVYHERHIVDSYACFALCEVGMIGGHMRCPVCGHPESKVVDSRPSDEFNSIRRRRECLKCGNRFTTYERLGDNPIIVVKSDGTTQVFDREKLYRGISIACAKRPNIPNEKKAEIIDDIEAELRAAGRLEIKSKDLGDIVLEHLRGLDDVAYIRFASVYKDFQTVEEFREALEGLQ